MEFSGARIGRGGGVRSATTTTIITKGVLTMSELKVNTICPVMPAHATCWNFNEKLCPFMSCNTCKSFIPKEWRKLTFINGQWYIPEEVKKPIKFRSIK